MEEDERLLYLKSSFTGKPPSESLNHLQPSLVVMSRVSFYSSFLLLLRLVDAQSSEFSNTSISPAMTILMIILVSVFFALACFSVLIRKCFDQVLRTSDGGYHRSGDPENWLNVRQTTRGLDASVIETFPTFRYSKVKTLRVGKEALECPVCLNEFEDNETLRLIPRCCHVFHPGCIETWLRSQTTCPLCRASLVPLPGESVSLEISGLARETGQNSLGTPTDVNQRRVLASPDDSVACTGNESMPRKSMSTGRKVAGLISQSSSPGQPEENLDRFTLRLPQEIHDQVMNSSLGNEGSKGHVALPQVRSSTRGFRTGSLGDERNYFYFKRFGQDGRFDRRPFSITPPFHTGSIGSPDGVINGGGNYHTLN